MLLIKLMTVYPRHHIHLDIVYKIFQKTKMEERQQHNFLSYSDEISSVCGMEILFHSQRKELKLSSFLAIDAKHRGFYKTFIFILFLIYFYKAQSNLKIAYIAYAHKALENLSMKM